MRLLMVCKKKYHLREDVIEISTPLEYRLLFLWKPCDANGIFLSHLSTLGDGYCTLPV